MVFQTTPNEILFLGDTGDVKGRVRMSDPQDGVIDIVETYVSPNDRGLGFAGRLMGRAAAYIKDSGNRAKLSCSYAKSWFAKHPEYQDIVDDAS